MSTSEDIQRLFLSAPTYALVGASKDPSKYGNKILKWYLNRKITVIPVNPREAEIEGIAVVKSLSDLPSPTTTSVTVITPPKVTLAVLKEAKALGIPALWIQPGAEDAEVTEWVRENYADKVVLGGPCIKVLGDAIIQSLKR